MVSAPRRPPDHAPRHPRAPIGRTREPATRAERPFSRTPAREARPRDHAADPASTEDDANDEAPSRARVVRQWTRAGLLLGLSGLCVWLNYWAPIGDRQPAPATPVGLASAIPTASRSPVIQPPSRGTRVTSENWHPLAREGMFAIGSTQAEVLEVQGRPTAVIGDGWFFGSSIVLFTDGRVTGYAIKDKSLKVGFDAASAEATAFGIGSSKDEVLAIQGAPTFMEEGSWGYGYSRVVFDDKDLVSSYSVMDEPLKTRK